MKQILLNLLKIQKRKKTKQRSQQAKIQKEKEAQLEHETPIEQKSEYVLEIYDPLSKDMDNDGVIDRYDNDFRDSTISYEEKDRKLVQEKNYKRKNYKQEFHRSSKAQEPVLETKRTKNEELLKDLPDDRKIKRVQSKQRKDLSKVQDSKGNLKKKNSLALASTGAVLETSKRYLKKKMMIMLVWMPVKNPLEQVQSSFMESKTTELKDRIKKLRQSENMMTRFY